MPGFASMFESGMGKRCYLRFVRNVKQSKELEFGQTHHRKGHAGSRKQHVWEVNKLQ